jgi:hypothetical protein
MKTIPRLSAVGFILLLALPFGVVGCSRDEPAPPPPPTHSEVKKSELGKHVWLETEGPHRRVRVDASVALRQGEYSLEFLLSKKFKEYESILVTTADAQVIHTALVAAGAEPGSPARFDPQFRPPTGSRIKITLEYEEKGKLRSVPAGSWIRDKDSKKELNADWVFAGSRLWPNPDGEDKPKLYAANGDGAYVCVINGPTAMIDLTVRSLGALEARSFEPFTEHIPELGTPVTVIFEPITDKKAPPSTAKE